MANKSKTAVSAETRYSKERLVKSKKYADMKNLIKALLVDGETYTIAEVEALLNNYLKGKVK